MKIKHLFLMTLVGLFMAACSSSDDDGDNNGGDNGGSDQEEVIDYAPNVAGTYTGDASLTVSGNVLSTAIDKSLVFTRTEDNLVSLELTLDYGAGTSMAVESVTANAKVSYNASSAKYVLETADDAGSTSSITILSVSGTIDQDKNVSFVLEFQPVGMPMSIVATFTTPSDYATEIAGTYIGEMGIVVAMAGLDEALGDKSTIITRTGENTVMITIVPEYPYGNMNIDRVNAPASVSYDSATGYTLTDLYAADDATYTLEYDDVSTVYDNYAYLDEGFGLSNPIIQSKANGTIKEGALDLTFDFKPGNMPMWINATHSATLVTE